MPVLPWACAAIVDDAAVYDQLKLMARFVRLAGFSGLLVGLDELVNLYKLANTQARNANYEQILRILNDSLQGTAVGLGLCWAARRSFCSTPDAACTATRRCRSGSHRTPLPGGPGGLQRAGRAPVQPHA
jgi:hypothetical protein